MGEILWETDSERLVLKHDDYAEMPDYDGACPVFEVERWGRVRIALGSNGYGLERHIANLRNAMIFCQERTSTAAEGIEMFARHVRIFHGGDVISEWRDGYDYVCPITSTMRDAWGCTDDIAPNMDEFLAYLDGEVFGVVLEEKTVVTYSAVTRRPDGSESVEAWEDSSWEEINSSWGLYGYDYARQYASEEYPTAD